MVQLKYGPESSHDEHAHRRMQVVYTRKMHERQVFMDELRELRKKKLKYILKRITESIGPKWYHALSVPQRIALDSLESSIYQDLLEGRPIRTAHVMRELGLYPRPNTVDLMNSAYFGRNDPKEMLAQLFLITYGHTIDGKRSSYCLNAKLMLSGILYLGLEQLIALLRERFRPDTKKEKPNPKPKPKVEPPLCSPYLQKMVAVLYERPVYKRPRPPPLPNLDDFNEPYEEEPVMPKPPPPPPPPPPPKKRLPRSYCDKISGIISIEPHSSVTALSMKTYKRNSHRRIRGSKLCVTEVKKTYGISMANQKKVSRRRKPVAPNTGMWNSQYVINGVYSIHGKTVFVLGTVSILPPVGDLIHGGYRHLKGEYINIHYGFAARPPPPKADPCDCVKKWHDSVFEYVRKTKCYCGHHYDYGNEGTFPPDELPFFQKPTRHSPFQFKYQTIYDTDEKRLHVEKEFKRVWDTDSMLHVVDGTVKDKKEKKLKKTKKSSTTCLGKNPRPEDYLKCALRLMRQVNIAARLPDIHLVPELKEWMRRRIHGPYCHLEKSEMLHKSTMYWQIFQTIAAKGFGHIAPLKDPTYAGHTTWVHKQNLNEKFRKFTEQYKLQLFRSQAKFNNLMWTTMCQAAFPDKKFREIYFSYLVRRVQDMYIIHPYSSKESLERKLLIAKKRYCCPPAGIEQLES
ncbi:uncharacterized protein LOC113522923 [Galleria mellonella]|uniref:Uncharacterized protein LOC113522923 n=1 Tax=Galleria mellonella TaxID=7137 RepID=A0A6J1X5B0_GALME|nr:uncharacterized protein LOC113522923 [Galleria mellonella]